MNTNLARSLSLPSAVSKGIFETDCVAFLRTMSASLGLNVSSASVLPLSLSRSSVWPAYLASRIVQG